MPINVTAWIPPSVCTVQTLAPLVSDAAPALPPEPLPPMNSVVLLAVSEATGQPGWKNQLCTAPVVADRLTKCFWTVSALMLTKSPPA